MPIAQERFRNLKEVLFMKKRIESYDLLYMLEDHGIEHDNVLTDNKKSIFEYAVNTMHWLESEYMDKCIGFKIFKYGEIIFDIKF